MSSTSSTTSSTLSAADETSILRLHKSVRATAFDDPADQDEFLASSADTVLQFREQIQSFASTPAVAECVFTIRSKMQQNNLKLKTPPAAIFASIVNFAGDIIRERQLLRDRKTSATVRARAEAGAAARSERRAAIKLANRISKRKSIPDPDAVSIPSSDDSEYLPPSPNPTLVEPRSPRVKSEPLSPSMPGLLSPMDIPELAGLHFLSLHMGRPLVSQPASPSLPPASQPHRVPIELPPILTAFSNGSDHPTHWMRNPRVCRDRVCTPHPGSNQTITPPLPPVLSHGPCIRKSVFPMPASTRPAPPMPTLIESSNASKPKSNDSLVPKKKSPRVYKPLSQILAEKGKPMPKYFKPRRCYICRDPTHVVVACPHRTSHDGGVPRRRRRRASPKAAPVN
ncbi:hypothetical protein R3P38DRAFT_2778867 [Favolaschia claudopus]|uniref:Gag-like protein n=1 Tax=Favolaschia claudopus TaxID=2862362 RepID=A0AAW0BFI1_9AGAR